MRTSFITSSPARSAATIVSTRSETIGQRGHQLLAAGSRCRRRPRPAVRTVDRTRCRVGSAESARRQTRRQLPSPVWPRTSTTTRSSSRPTPDCAVRSRDSMVRPDGRRCARCCRRCAGLRVVDLGCGYGWFSRWAAAAGAASVLGIDISERMLARAGRRHHRRPNHLPASRPRCGRSADCGIRCRLQLAGAPLPRRPRSDPATVHRSLVTGGMFVFSIEHPIYSAPIESRIRHRLRRDT